MTTQLCPTCLSVVRVHVQEFPDPGDPGGGMRYVRAWCTRPGCNWREEGYVYVPGQLTLALCNRRPTDRE